MRISLPKGTAGPTQTRLETWLWWGLRRVRGHSPAPAPAGSESAEVTDRLYARLGSLEIEEVERRLFGDEAALLAGASPSERRRILLTLGAYYRVPNLLKKTGLTFATPPESVHAMSRGKLAGIGSLHYADLIMEAVRHAGVKWSGAGRALDFGCSSGRVVRVLAAAYPQMEWFGCDPNAEAIAWAQHHLPNIAFDVNSLEPPLPYADGQFDMVFAISIWSHFGASAAIRWFYEMRRIIRKGGHLIFTTHGYRSIEYYARNGARPATQLNEIRQSLQRTGFWYCNEFGERGDWGVTHTEWGTAFMASDWWLTRLCSEWAALWFRPGRVEGNQDLIVLERRRDS